MQEGVREEAPHLPLKNLLFNQQLKAIPSSSTDVRRHYDDVLARFGDTWAFGLHPAWDLLLLVLTHSVAFQCMHEQMVVVGVWWVFNLIKSDPRTAIKRIQ